MDTKTVTTKMDMISGATTKTGLTRTGLTKRATTKKAATTEVFP